MQPSLFLKSRKRPLNLRGHLVSEINSEALALGKFYWRIAKGDFASRDVCLHAPEAICSSNFAEFI
mgnify:CR=1 FL=1